MAAQPSVSVLFLTKERPQLLQRAVNSVLDDPATAEVIVVVDGDDPGTADLLSGMKQAEPRLRVTSLPPPGADDLDSMQRGRDHGAAFAGADVILALDDDVVAHPGLVSGHAARHADREDAVVVGYMPVATAPGWPASQAPVRFYAESYESTCERYEADPESILRGLWGGNVSVRRDRWLRAIEAGRVRCYHEDKEFGIVLSRAGLRGLFDRGLRGDHYYERNLRGFVARAETSTAAQAQLRAAYPDAEVPEVLEDDSSRGRLARRIVAPAAAWWLVKWTLIGAITLAGALRIRRLEDLGARLLWRLAEEHSAQRLAGQRR
jgi:glycosyltransferase involved in cell wall biosynthesis